MVHSPDKFFVQHVYGIKRDHGIKKSDLERLGSTVNRYGSSLYVYGGIKFNTSSTYNFLEYNMDLNKWSGSKNSSTHRYYHCSVLYKVDSSDFFKIMFFIHPR